MALVVIACCACLMAGLALWKFVSIDRPPGPRDVKDWRTYAVGDKRIGSADARIVITEFSDFRVSNRDDPGAPDARWPTRRVHGGHAQFLAALMALSRLYFHARHPPPIAGR